jgi:hypothetical protein
MYREGSYKWPFAIIASVLLALGFCYPTKTLFLFKFFWDLVVLNLEPLIKTFHAKFG